ncbi:MAG: response regulator transcription factor [Bacteroidia bacterium]|nr:response regulator transcription factor [Bacteroidia bacterium]
MKVIIADKHFLSRTGLEYIIQKYFEKTRYLVSSVHGFIPLSQQIKTFMPDIVLLDYISMNIKAEEVQKLMVKYPEVKFIFITEWLPKTEWLPYFQLDIKWHLLKECDEQEIKECIEYAMNNQSFFCNKLIQFIQSNEESIQVIERNNMSCNGIVITQREREIIQLIAEGMSNKQIADSLNLSIHTVLTHRKNIMKKTNVSNTAGLVLFALKNNILRSDNHFLFA